MKRLQFVFGFSSCPTVWFHRSPFLSRSRLCFSTRSRSRLRSRSNEDSRCLGSLSRLCLLLLSRSRDRDLKCKLYFYFIENMKYYCIHAMKRGKICLYDFGCCWGQFVYVFNLYPFVLCSVLSHRFIGHNILRTVNQISCFTLIPIKPKYVEENFHVWET